MKEKEKKERKFPLFTLALKRKWVKALRSGKFRQGHLRLKGRNAGGPLTYCCLGVLATVAKLPFKRERTEYEYTIKGDPCYLPFSIIPIRVQHKLSNMNDGMAGSPKTFQDIADYIEKKVFPRKKG